MKIVLETREVHLRDVIRLEIRIVRDGVAGEWRECVTERIDGQQT